MDDYKANRYGHRERMRNQYIEGGFAGMSDSSILELFLGQMIPQRDVKPIVYELQNHFNSLEGIFNASLDELKKINSIGENTATLINLAGKMMGNMQGDEDVRCLRSIPERRKHLKRICAELKTGTIVITSLDNRGYICYNQFISASAQLSPKIKVSIAEWLIDSNASSCIVAYYTPNNEPLEIYINFFSDVKFEINKIGVRLTDAGIIADGNILLLSESAYKAFIQ